MGNGKSHNETSSPNPDGSILSFHVDIASFLSNLSMRSSGMSVRSATSTNTVQKARILRRQPKSKTVSDPYLNSRTVWPVTFCEAPFLPEFPIRGKVDENSFQAIELISSGAYGKVHKVRKKDTGVVYAMKVMSKSKIFVEDAVNQVKDEIRVQTMCGHHPFLNPAPFHWQSRKHLYLVTEYIEGGDLHQLWKETGCFEEELIRIYIAEVALTLDFLHNAGIIYRDLKMENILLDAAGHVKLIDFGLSKWLPIGSKTQTLCGTLHYMAPEVLRQEPYGHAVDWWSLGVLLFALLQGQFPFRNLSDCEETTASFELSGHAETSQGARKLVQSLLAKDCTQRLRSLRQLERHAFYHHFDFHMLRSKKIEVLALLERQQRKCRPVDESVDQFENFDQCLYLE